MNDAWLPDSTGTLDRAEGLADIIARTPQHASALATSDRLHRQAGLEPPHLTVEPEHDLHATAGTTSSTTSPAPRHDSTPSSDGHPGGLSS